MPNPVFISYDIKHADAGVDNGEITNVIVSGDQDTTLTVSWTGPNGYTSQTFDGATPHSIIGLEKGTYNGTVTDNNGLTGTTIAVIQAQSTCDNPSIFANEDYFESSGSTTQSFLEFYTGENNPIDGVFNINDIIIKSPKPKNGEVDCNDASLKINISKLADSSTNTCDYVSFTLDANGKVLFTHGDGSIDYNITQECCSSLGFTPELSEFGVYNCRWQEVSTDPCQNFIITNNTDNNGYTLFVNGETGEFTNTVPTAECCIKEGLVSTQHNDGFYCTQPTQEPSCSDYTFSGTFADGVTPEEKYAIFYFESGTTNAVPTAECCSANGLESTNIDGGIKCYEAVPDCSGYIIKGFDENGYVLFTDGDNNTIQEVYDVECCTTHDFDYEVKSENGSYICKKKELDVDLPILEYVNSVEDEQLGCTELFMRIIGVPDSYVKFRVTLLRNPDHGYNNNLINTTTGESITPVMPLGGVGSYCEGTVYVDSSGVTELKMTTCARPPLREFTNNCVELKYEIYDYDNNTVKPTNHQYNQACFPV